MTASYKNRYINRGILEDQEINAGGLIARDLAIGLTLLADDQGRLTAAIRWIWKEVFKHQDNISIQAGRKAFNHLASPGVRFVQLYRFGDEIYLQIRNWHKFQPQKVDRFRWSHLPAPPDWDPEKYLPPRLLDRWKVDEKTATFSAPPISSEWVSGATVEPPRSRHVSASGDAMEPPRRHSGDAAEPLARVGSDKGKSGQSGTSGRVDEETRGDNGNVSREDHQPVPPYAPTTSRGNGGPIQWSDWTTLPPIKRRIHLTNWLFQKHGWATVKPDTLAHEHALADHIAQLAIDDGDDLHRMLEAWWDESDPDDRPSSLEYFWTRLQQHENERLKQEHRPHVQSEAFTRAGDSLPDIRKPKGKT